MEVVWLRHDSFMIAYTVPLCKQEFTTTQTQRFAGKKVSLRRRQQADTPNHCSTWHKSIKILLWYASNCYALRAAIAGLSYCLQFLRLRSGSYYVLHPASFIHSSFVALHPFTAHQFVSGLGTLGLTHKGLMKCTQSLSQSHSTAHWVSFHSFRRYFISAGLSPSAAYNLARRPPTSAAFTLRMLIAHSYLISQSTAKVHLHSSAAFVP